MSVRSERRDGVVTITLDRPDKLNAMTDAMWSTLDRLLAELTADPTVRALVLSGAGDTFCAGSDVTGLIGDLSSLPERMRLSNRCVAAVYAAPFPTVAAVDGVAAGAGANLALACDFVVAADRARFMQLFVKRGLSLDSGASWLLPRLVGDRRARQLAILGGSLDAATALDWGLITAVASADRLRDDVGALATRLAGLPPAAVAGTKSLLRQSWSADLPTALEHEIDVQVAVIESPEARQALRDFARA